MSTYSYREVLHQIQQLSSDEQRLLLEELSKSLQDKSSNVPRRRHSIMEFKGLGKEIWQGIDAQEYVRQERNSWND